MIAAGENSNDLDYISQNALILNSGTIKDPAGNNANLILPTPGQSGSLSSTKNIVHSYLNLQLAIISVKQATIFIS